MVSLRSGAAAASVMVLVGFAVLAGCRSCVSESREILEVYRSDSDLVADKRFAVAHVYKQGGGAAGYSYSDLLLIDVQETGFEWLSSVSGLRLTPVFDLTWVDRVVVVDCMAVDRMGRGLEGERRFGWRGLEVLIRSRSGK